MGVIARYAELLHDDTGHVNTAINCYAAFIGYVSMAIRGLGFLILTWTTVVLLGGFVSALQNKDFWCLTFITLVQTAGIFDVCLNEKLSFALYSSIGLIMGTSTAIHGSDILQNVYCVRVLLVCVCFAVQVLVLIILLCPLAAVYVFGLLISTVVSIWRLIQHDYGSHSNEQANLKPAMDTLYCLALLQGVLFLYRFSFARVGKMLVKEMIPSSEDLIQLEAVLNYLSETKIGCEKNPAFVRGRSFTTHAVDLICSKSPSDCLSGVQLLYTAICIEERRLKNARDMSYISFLRWKQVTGQHTLMKHLIVSASSSPVPQKVLLQTLNPRGMHDSEARNQAARIVAYVALDIHLEQFPWAVHQISTLIGTFEEYRLIESYHRDWTNNILEKYCNRQATHHLPSPVGNDEDKLREAHEKLVLRGLCILRKLATDKNNCRIMSETQGLLPRIIAPLTSDLIHQFRGGSWSISVVEGSLKVIRLLVVAAGVIGASVRREISDNKEAIRTMERILNCHYCHVKLQKQAMGILIQLYIDIKSRPTLIKMLVDIFVADGSSRRDRSIRKLAGQALAELCFQSGSNTGFILQVDDDVVGSLIKICLDDGVENRSCRIRAAEILEHMCNIHHTQDDVCISKLKKSMTTTMPKVLAQVLGYDLVKDKTGANTQASQLTVLVKKSDIENQHKKDKSSSIHPKYKECEGDLDVEEDEFENEEDDDAEFRTPFLSLCVTVCETFISSGDEELSSQFDAISLPKKLKEMVERNSVPTVCCLRLMKVTCKMVISMMKYSDRYDIDELDSLMNALSSASESMVHLDMSMVFAREDDGARTTKPVKSLHSLVTEAKESVETRRATKAHESENIMEPSTSGLPPMVDTVTD